jgi:hypothetical protein
MRRPTAGAVVHSFASCGFVATSADQLSAGAVFEVKCLFAIDSITPVYRADWAQNAVAVV